MPVNLHQSHFRFGRDSGTESTHTFYALEDVSIAHSPDFTFLIRFCEQETGATAAANTDAQLQCNKNGGAWQNVTTTSSIVKAVVAAAFANADNCTKRLSGTGTFEASGQGCCEDGLSGGAQNDIAASGNSETEFSIQIVGADVVHGDVIGLRFTSPDWAVTYDVNATVTVSKNNGFQTSSPTVRFGIIEFNEVANKSRARKFVCPGSGTQEITEIGAWVSADAATTTVFKLAIFTHDAANNNPDTMVANSESAELSHNTTTVTKKSHTYGTKPQLTGGSTYWLARLNQDANMNIDSNEGGGVMAQITTITYPTWPTADQWDTATDIDDDDGIYAVYQAPAVDKAIADSGSGADAQIIAAALAIAETGAGADVLSISELVEKSLADSGVGSDVIAALSVALSATDGGTGSDAIAALEAALAILDTGTGIDALELAITVFKALSDSGSGVDTISLLQAVLSIAESGSGYDAVSLIDAILAMQDSGAGADTLALIAQLVLSEIGSGADAMSVQEFLDVIYKTLEDGGSGADVLAAIQAAIAIQDAGSGIDLVALAAEIPIGDSGGGIDAVSLVASLGLGDAGVGADDVLFYAPLNIVDVGSGADLLSLLNQIALADDAAGTDTMVRVIEGPVIPVELLDSGTGVDALSVEAQLALSDLGAGIDAMLLQGAVVIVDAGGALDRMMIPRLASARDTYNAMARKREYDAGKRKREYNATARKREHDDQ
jgi:hypothetical protein